MLSCQVHTGIGIAKIHMQIGVFKQRGSCMKRIYKLIVATWAVLALSSTANATSYYYTFEGLMGANYDGAGIIADLGGPSAIGPLEFVVRIDFDDTASYTLNNGNVLYYADSGLSDFSYAEYVSGTALQEKNGGYYNGPTQIGEYNIIYENLTNNYSEIVVGSADAGLKLYTYNGYNHPYELVENWGVGDQVLAFTWAYSNNGQYSSYNSNVMLTSISIVDVPEPSTLFLLGSGLATCAAIFRKKLAIL